MENPTGASASPSSSRLPEDIETLEMIYHVEEDPAKRAAIRRQLEEMRKQVETR